MDLMPGNDGERNSETAIITIQQLRKYAAVLEQLLDSGILAIYCCTVGSGVFYGQL
jgi:hypothetical protein